MEKGLALPKKIKRYGFEYELMISDQNKAIYIQYFEGKRIGYEVCMLKEKSRNSSKLYPKNEDFGKKAWAFRTEKAAFDFYYNLAPSVDGQMELPF